MNATVITIRNPHVQLVVCTNFAKGFLGPHIVNITMSASTSTSLDLAEARIEPKGPNHMTLAGDLSRRTNAVVKHEQGEDGRKRKELYPLVK